MLEADSFIFFADNQPLPCLAYISRKFNCVLRFFSVNDPYRLLAAFVIFLLVSLPVFLHDFGMSRTAVYGIVLGQKMWEGFTPYITLLDQTPILSLWLNQFFFFLAGKSAAAREIIAFSVLLFQGAYLAVIFIQKKAFEENTYLPALIFVLLCTLSFDLFSVTPTLLASGFLLLAINSLFKEIEFKNYQDDQVLVTGFYLGLTTLAANSFIIFFFGAWLILFLFTRSTLRKHLLFVTGFVFPHLLLLTAYWFFGYAEELINHYYYYFFHETEALLKWKELLVMSIIPLFFLVVAFFRLTGGSRLTNYQSQLVQMMFLWLIIGFVHLFFASELRPQSLLPMFPPLCFLISHFLLTIQRKRWGEVFLWLMLIGIPLYAWLLENDKINWINNASLYVKTDTEAKRIRALVLENQNSLGLIYEPATGLMSGKQKEALFTNEVTYSKVSKIDEQLRLGNPVVIVDPNNWMQPFWKHLPQWEKKYKKIGNYYYLQP